MHKKSRMELGSTNMTVENENKACGIHRKSRMELGCAIMTVGSESQVC